MALLGLLLVLTVVSASEPEKQLSLQLKRSQGEVTPPPEEQPVEGFARFDRTIGGFGIVSGYFDEPNDITVDPEEVIFVLDYGNDRVQRFDSNGEYLSQFGETGSRDGQFDEPLAISVDQNGFIYVVDADNHRIQKFDGEGRFLLSWGSLGSRQGFFNRPRDIAFDEDNNAYVADPGNDRIQKFTSSGSFIEEWDRRSIRTRGVSPLGTIISLGFDDDRFGYMLALSEKDRTVQRFELDGDFVDSFDINPAGECTPVRIEVDNDNDLVFIVDKDGNRILRYTKEGSYEGELTGGDTPFSSPMGVFVDRRRKRLYVTDTGNNIVQKFYISIK